MSLILNVCFSREAHGRKEKRERPLRLRDKGSGVLLEHSKRDERIARPCVFCIFSPARSEGGDGLR